jgi:hypothetical protein
MIINLLLLRSINRDERPETTAELLLKMLFGALRPELVTSPCPHRSTDARGEPTAPS